LLFQAGYQIYSSMSFLTMAASTTSLLIQVHFII
jgi:hypothetical protein